MQRQFVTSISQHDGKICRKLIYDFHGENYISISFHIEWDMILVTVFLSILNQMEIYLIQNRIENCHHDHIPFNMKEKGNIVFSEYIKGKTFEVAHLYIMEAMFRLCRSANIIGNFQRDKGTHTIAACMDRISKSLYLGHRWKNSIKMATASIIWTRFRLFCIGFCSGDSICIKHFHD